jgi:beta-lactamase class A
MSPTLRSRTRRPSVFVLGPGFLCLSLLAAPAPLAAQSGTNLLETELEHLSEGVDGVVGVGVYHLESGRSAYTHADEAFPMASTYKVPIAVQLLTRVDRGELALDQMIEVEAGDIHPGSGTISRLLDDPGVSLSVLNLLELMLLISDNSATDLCLRLAGGPDAVNQRMAELGVSGLRVDRPTSLLIGDWLGLTDLPADGRISPEAFDERREAVPEEEQEKAEKAFRTDPRDTSTPRAMTELLVKIWKGETLSEESTALLLDVLERVETGQARLKGVLPPDVTVAHKTGTIGATTNDVGIVYLPGDAGHVAVVAFVKDSERPIPAREAVIAQVARAAYDYFLFNPS